MDISSKYPTKTQLVYELLREGIVGGEYRPGQHLLTSELARRFKVSEVPVREALIRLDADGLVTRYSNTRTVVTELDLDELIELLHIREVLEALAARFAAIQAGPKLARVLQRLIAKMEAVVRSGDSLRYGKLNREFHEAIYAQSGRHLFALICNLWDKTERSRTVLRAIPKHMQNSLEEHRRIAAAVVAGDADLSERLVLEHRRSVIRAIRQAIINGDWTLAGAVGAENEREDMPE